MLHHLVQNAFLHAFDGPGCVTIQVNTVTADWLELIVSDNGKGIAKEDLPRIFDPFFTTRFGTGSSGLGLNITHNIVTEILGGRIQASSESGHGSHFILNLPISAPQRNLSA